MRLQNPSANYNARLEIERNRQIEQADAENHKRNRDVEVGIGRLILTSDDGTRYELELANDGYVKIKTINGEEVPGLNQSQFSENITAERTPVIELNSAYGTSALRDVETVTNSGAISASATGEILLSTGATATSKAVLESAERGRYIPGYGAESGIGIRVPTAPTGNQFARWGLWDTASLTEGFYFGVDATGIYTAYTRGSTESKVYQSSWNIDKLDGTGKSGYTITQSDGVIYRINFTWYGYGQILFGVIAVVDDVQRFVPCHSLRVTSTTSVQNPNLTIFAESNNGGDAVDLDVYVGGRNYAIVGKYVPQRRVTGQERGSVSTSTTIEPLVTFRRKAAFLDRSVKVQGFDADVATAAVIIEIRLNGSLTGASYTTPTNHTAAETALEVDTSATAITGGEVIYSKYLPSGSVGKESAAGAVGIAIDIDIPTDQPVTLCARTLSGTGTVVSHLRMTEEW